MRSLFEKKPWVLLLSVLALGALTALAVSVGNVSFGGPQPIGRDEAEGAARLPTINLSPVNDVTVSSQIALWVALAVLVALVGVLLSPEARRKMIRILIRTAFTVWALYILLDRYPDVFGFLTPILHGGFSTSQSLEGQASVPPPVFAPPQESPILSYAISLLVVLAVGFLGWRAYLAWRAMTPRPSASLQSLARIARASLYDLSSGRETTDVIMNCYFRMSDVVADKRNLHRGADMTPAEFAFRLEEAGLPADAVRRLTRLFEGVRYGQRKAGPKDVNEAVACLTSILQYCGEPV